MDLNVVHEESLLSDWIFVLVMVPTAVLASLFGEFVRRIFIFLQELYFSEKRFDKMTAFKNIMSVFGFVQFGIAALCVAIVVWFSIYRATVLNAMLIASFSASYLILHIAGMWKPSPAELKSMYGNQINFGYCFAWQYYLGYLKIILPELQKRISKYENESGVQLRYHKLILVMPRSCQLAHDLSKCPGDEDTIEFAKNLETVVQDRSGNKGRKYKNSVWRIKHYPEPIYCCMEGSAILNSLYDMKLKCPLTCEKMRQEFDNFCTALKCILEKEKMEHLVEMIVYDDKDENGKLRRLSDVIKERMVIMAADDIPVSC